MKKIFICVLIGCFLSCEKIPTTYNELNELPITEKLSSMDLEEVVEVEETEDVPFRKMKTRNQVGKKIERKLIKNGRIKFKTDSIQSAKQSIIALVQKHKGYVSSDNTNKNSYRINQFLTLRIPIDNFERFLQDLSNGVSEFEQKEIRVSDVTARFYDLTARLKTKKELEARYLQILKKTKNVKEILEVEKQLGILREEIESKEGQLKLLTNQVSMSTINISFYQLKDRPSDQSNQFIESFSDGIKAIKAFVLFVISIWPFVILGFVSFFLVKRRIKSKANS